MSSQSKKAAVAVIGMGDMGQTHADVYRRHPDAELVAVVDNRSGAAADYAQEHHVPFSYTSVEELVAAVSRDLLKLDGVSVCVPNSFHADISIAMLRAGVNVMCEKPAADTLAAALRIGEVAETASAKISFGYLYRHHPETRQWSERVAAGLGQLLLGEISVMRRDGRPDRPAFLNRQLTGGGPGVDLLPHALAVVGDAVGLVAPASVAATTVPRRWKNDDEVENLAFGAFTLGRGGLVAPGAQLWVKTSWKAKLPEGEPDERWTIRLTGTDRAFEVEMPIGEEPAQAGYDAELDLFLARVRGEQPWGNDLEHALWIQQIVDDLYRSAENNGKSIRVS